MTKAFAALAAMSVAVALWPVAAEPHDAHWDRELLHEILDRAQDADDVVEQTCRRLVEVGDSSSVPHLIRVLGIFPEGERSVCVEALERITGKQVGVTYADWERWWYDTHPNEPLWPPPERREVTRSQLVYGFQVTTPQKLSASVGTVVSLRAGGYHRNRHGPEGGGLLLQVEPGLGGIKGSVGYGSVGWGGAWSARLTGLRTWGDPWGADGDITYVGPEATLSFFGLKGGLGALRQVSGTGDDWLFTATLGVGF